MWPPTGLIPWFSKTEGNTYATLLHRPFLFKGKTNASSRGSTPGSTFYHICFPIYLLPFLFSDLLYQKPKNTLLHFFFTYFISCFIQIYLSKLIQINLSFYRGGIDNPSYALGCEDLFFVCRYRSHSVAWFSYWIDTLVS